MKSHLNSTSSSAELRYMHFFIYLSQESCNIDRQGLILTLFSDEKNWAQKMKGSEWITQLVTGNSRNSLAFFLPKLDITST